MLYVNYQVYSKGYKKPLFILAPYYTTKNQIIELVKREHKRKVDEIVFIQFENDISNYN